MGKHICLKSCLEIKWLHLGMCLLHIPSFHCVSCLRHSSLSLCVPDLCPPEYPRALSVPGRWFGGLRGDTHLLSRYIMCLLPMVTLPWTGWGFYKTWDCWGPAYTFQQRWIIIQMGLEPFQFDPTVTFHT